MLRDVVELRANKWVLCREDHYISETINQIHKQVQQSTKVHGQLSSRNKQWKKGRYIMGKLNSAN